MNPAENLKQSSYPCEQCGASLRFSIGSGDLSCSYCGHNNPIPQNAVEIQEYRFEEALQRLAQAKNEPIRHETVVHCTVCAAKFKWDEHIHAGECPFCGTAVISSTEHLRLLKPRSLLPFQITHQQGQTAFKDWIHHLWFAPSAVKHYARSDEKLLGVFLPYWTYDSQTDSRYHGYRGDVYYENERYMTTINGREVEQVRQVAKIRWTATSGRVQRHFDDVLIGASKTLPRTITSRLEPWDLQALVPFDEQYLSGFQSEVYQVELKEGFDDAKHLMDQVIRRDVRQDIGGDRQKISHLETQHRQVTFKHLLLPIWSAAFHYRQKTYRFVINGRTGNVQGERPYSWIKISVAVLLTLTVFAGVVWFLDKSGLLSQIK